MQYVTNNRRKNFDVIFENMVLQDFLVLKNLRKNQIMYPDPEPPDALIKLSAEEYIWLEFTRVLDERTAKILYDDEMYLKEDRYIISPIDYFVDKAKCSINKKDSKQSYLNLVQKYGKGILLFDILDPLLTRDMELIVANKLYDFYKNITLESFNEIYLYRKPNGLPEWIKIK